MIRSCCTPILLFLLLPVTLLCPAARATATDNSPPHRVAVIGSGVAGSSAALFLRRAFDGAGVPVEVDVYEAEEKAGGRAKSVRVGGETFNAGAGIFLRANRYVASLADEAGINATVPTHSGFNRLGVWDPDTSSFLFQESEYAAVTGVRALLRYGPLVFWSLRDRVREAVERWERVYGLQARGAAYETPEALLRELGLLRHASQTVAAALRGSRAEGSRLLDEVAYGMAGVNYNGQDLSRMNAFVGMIALAPLLAESDALHVREGNELLCEGALRLSGARLLAGRRVTEVRQREADGRWTVAAEGGGEEGGGAAPYDDVILAAPLVNAGVRVVAADGSEVSTAPRNKFHPVVNTYVRGLVNPGFWKRRTHADMPSQVVVARGSEGGVGTPVNFFSVQRKLGERDFVYKTFSTEPLPKLFMRFCYRRKTEVVEHVWDAAYPVYDGPAKFTPFVLHPGGVYHAGALESAASAMEVAAVSARNVVNLLARARGVGARPGPGAGEDSVEGGDARSGEL